MKKNKRCLACHRSHKRSHEDKVGTDKQYDPKCKKNRKKRRKKK